jgi:hypothetical protein
MASIEAMWVTPASVMLLSPKSMYSTFMFSCDNGLRVVRRPLVRFHEERRWLFEEPTQSRMSPSILLYTKICKWRGFGVRGVAVQGLGLRVQGGECGVEGPAYQAAPSIIISQNVFLE